MGKRRTGPTERQRAGRHEADDRLPAEVAERVLMALAGHVRCPEVGEMGVCVRTNAAVRVERVSPGGKGIWVQIVGARHLGTPMLHHLVRGQRAHGWYIRGRDSRESNPEDVFRFEEQRGP